MEGEEMIFDQIHIQKKIFVFFLHIFMTDVRVLKLLFSFSVLI